MSDRTSRSLSRLLLLGAMAFAVWPGATWAYLDPAAGSMLLQLLLGGAAGIAVAVKLFWRRAAERFSHRESDKPQS